MTISIIIRVIDHYVATIITKSANYKAGGDLDDAVDVKYNYYFDMECVSSTGIVLNRWVQHDRNKGFLPNENAIIKYLSDKQIFTLYEGVAPGEVGVTNQSEFHAHHDHVRYVTFDHTKGRNLHKIHEMVSLFPGNTMHVENMPESLMYTYYSFMCKMDWFVSDRETQIKMIRNHFAIISQHRRDIAIENVRKQRERGNAFGPVPFGYQRVHVRHPEFWQRTRQVNSKEMDVVREILDSNMTCRKTAEYLNSLGPIGRDRYDLMWTAERVRYIRRREKNGYSSLDLFGSVLNESVADESVLNESVLNESVLNESVADESVADEPVSISDESTDELSNELPYNDELFCLSRDGYADSNNTMVNEFILTMLGTRMYQTADKMDLIEPYLQILVDLHHECSINICCKGIELNEVIITITKLLMHMWFCLDNTVNDAVKSLIPERLVQVCGVDLTQFECFDQQSSPDKIDEFFKERSNLVDLVMSRFVYQDPLAMPRLVRQENDHNVPLMRQNAFRT